MSRISDGRCTKRFRFYNDNNGRILLHSNRVSKKKKTTSERFFSYTTECLTKHVHILRVKIEYYVYLYSDGRVVRLRVR